MPERQAIVAKDHLAALAELVIEHYEGMLADYGIEVGVRAARKHLDWYLEASGIAVGKEERRALIECLDPREVVQRVRTIFSEPLREAA